VGISPVTLILILPAPFTGKSQKHRESSIFVGISHTHNEAHACVAVSPGLGTCRHGWWRQAPHQRAAAPCGGRAHLASTALTARRTATMGTDVPPHATAAGPAATAGGGTLHVSAGERAATAVLPFSLRGGPFCHFTRAGGPF
jgi:hypothetical protein